jgi:hypothetical protein
MYQAANSRNRSSVRASRPISVLGALSDALLVGAFSAAALALACLLIARYDVLDPFTDDFLIVRLVMPSPGGFPWVVSKDSGGPKSYCSINVPKLDAIHRPPEHAHWRN